MKLNYIGDKKSQNIIVTLGKRKNLSPEEVIKSSITESNLKKIKEYDCIDIALECWKDKSRADFLLTLQSPIMEVPLSSEQGLLIKKVKKKYSLDNEKAVAAFCLIQLHEFGLI